MKTLPDLLRTRAASAPDAPFLFFKDEVWTRGELARAAEEAGAANGRGSSPGIVGSPGFFLT